MVLKVAARCLWCGVRTGAALRLPRMKSPVENLADGIASGFASITGLPAATRFGVLFVGYGRTAFALAVCTTAGDGDGF